LTATSLKKQTYEIDGYNYIKLRDLAAAFDFKLDWNDAEKMISIDTGKLVFEGDYSDYLNQTQ